MARKLSLKMRTFCFAFAGEADGNATEAARIAKYKGSDATLRVVASKLLTKANIQECIQELRRGAEKKASGKILSAAEVLVGITKIAQSDIADVIDDPFLQAAKLKGVSRLIKSINFDKDTGRVTRIEMYNAQTAFVDLGKHLGLFPTKIEITPSDADRLIDGAAKTHGLPLPDLFGEPSPKSEM